MSKRIEAQDGNISINPITGVVEVYNVNSLVTQTTTAALGGLLVDQGLGLSPVITESTLPLTDGTADGDMLYWDQTGTQTFLASSNISWSETNQRLTLGDTGHKAGKDVSAFTFFNNADDKIMSFTDTDGGVILIEEAAMRFQAGNYLEIFGTGGGRSRIETDATNRLHFTLDTGIIGAAFDYPIAILRSNGAPPAAYGGHAQLWVAGHSSFTDVHMSMNGDGITWPIANYTELNYRFNNPTAAADPGDNFMRVNNAAFASATELYFDDLDYGENDTAWFWSMLAVGDTLQLHQGTDSTRWMHCRVDSITDNTGWYTIGITPLEHNGTVFINGDDVRVMVVRTSLGTMGNIGGSIADNQIAVGAATANDIEGDANFTWDGTTLTVAGAGSQVLLQQENDATTPTLAFGDGDSGFYESTDDNITLSLGTVATWDFTGSLFQGVAGGTPALASVDSTATVPNILPWKGDLDTGIGLAAADQLSLIAGGTEMIRLVEDTTDWIQLERNTYLLERASAIGNIANYGQIWVRDDAPNVLMYTDDTGNDFIANNVLEIEYAYDSATAVADPGAGTLRFDTVTIGSITEMYIDDLDNTGRDNSIMLANLAVGDLITFRSATDPADYIVATVDAATTDNAGYWTIPLAPVHVGTIFTNGDLLRMSVEWQSQAIAGSGTVTTSGSPLVNQLAYFSDPTTITGDADFTTDGNVLYIGNDTSSRELRLGGNATTARSFISMKDVGGTARTIVQRASSNNYLEIGSSFFGTIIDGGGVASPNSVAVNVPTTFAISNSGFTEYGQFNIGGSNLNLIGTSINSFKINNMTLMLEEQASAAADAANFGQIWVQTETPNRLVFTDDTGQDIRVTPNQATVQTTDATLTELIAISVPTDTTFGFRMNVVGTQATTGDTVFESIFGAVRNQASTTALVGSTVVDRTDDAGATTWVIDVTATSTPDELVVSVTGEAAHTIDWKVSVEILEV